MILISRIIIKRREKKNKYFVDKIKKNVQDFSPTKHTLIDTILKIHISNE